MNVQALTAKNKPERTAVVTGGAAGIGKAISRRLLEDGFRVIIADRDLPLAKDAATSLGALGEVRAEFVDMGSAESVSQLFIEVEVREGGCDALVNNAGIAPTALFENLKLHDWLGTISVNLTGPMLAAQAALPTMLKRGWGRIVNITSISGLRAGATRSAYGTSKAALTGLTRQIAIEVAHAGVTVNAVAPGPVDTDMTRTMHSPETRESYLRAIPMRRYGSTTEVAAAVSFLCSDEASFITGHTIPVDGGFMAAGIIEV